MPEDTYPEMIRVPLSSVVLFLNAVCIENLI
jgi:HrpA-like RNA helicase